MAQENTITCMYNGGTIRFIDDIFVRINDNNTGMKNSNNSKTTRDIPISKYNVW